MANKQYIYSGSGNPNTNAVVPDSLTAHYLDLGNGDIWVHDETEWKLIYKGGSSGNVSYTNSGSAPAFAPESPAMHVALSGGAYKVYVSAKDASDAWIWVEISATATV